MSGGSLVKRAGRRGRRPSKVDVKVKLERSRQSARECRARKKLRYQYLEELVNNRERAVYALRSELEQFRNLCATIDKGQVPEGLKKALDALPSPVKLAPTPNSKQGLSQTTFDILADVLDDPASPSMAEENPGIPTLVKAYRTTDLGAHRPDRGRIRRKRPKPGTIPSIKSATPTVSREDAKREPAQNPQRTDSPIREIQPGVQATEETKQPDFSAKSYSNKISISEGWRQPGSECATKTSNTMDFTRERAQYENHAQEPSDIDMLLASTELLMGQTGPWCEQASTYPTSALSNNQAMSTIDNSVGLTGTPVRVKDWTGETNLVQPNSVPTAERVKGMWPEMALARPESSVMTTSRLTTHAPESSVMRTSRLTTHAPESSVMRTSRLTTHAPDFNGINVFRQDNGQEQFDSTPVQSPTCGTSGHALLSDGKDGWTQISPNTVPMAEASNSRSHSEPILPSSEGLPQSGTIPSVSDPDFITSVFGMEF